MTTITTTVVHPDRSPRRWTKVNFIPLSGAVLTAGFLIDGIVVALTSITGALSVQLEPGTYAVEIDGERLFLIQVPGDGLTYALDTLVTEIVTPTTVVTVTQGQIATLLTKITTLTNRVNFLERNITSDFGEQPAPPDNPQTA